jgi:hypothetical protein
MFEVLLFLPQRALISKAKIGEGFYYRINQFKSITFFDRQHQLSVGLSFKKLYSSGKFSDKKYSFHIKSLPIIQWLKW